MAVNYWTREQTIVAFNLYCKIPFNKVTSNHPEIIKIAQIIGRSTNSVKMKIGNFGSFDEELKKRGIVGLSNVSRLDKEIWEEFHNNWEKLSFESEMLISQFKGENIENIFDNEQSLIEGKDKLSLVKTRVNQNVFRQMVISNYTGKCAISGIDIPELLVASHIVPWSINEEERLNPENGICFSALYDKAFDKGLIGIDEQYKILLSKNIKKNKEAIYYDKYFAPLENQTLTLPQKYLPKKEFIQYHLDVIFQKI